METAPSPHRTVASLRDLLAQASGLEHLLALEYLFAAFSLKKFPEEFDTCDLHDPKARARVDAQIERNRRWAAEILFVARQEMEHLAMVQNLLALLGEPPSLWRPNFPIPRASYPLGPEFALRRLDETTLLTFRYYEKPENLDLPLPPGTLDPDHPTPFETAHDSLQALYAEVQAAFDELLGDRRIQDCAPGRIVAEHFGFNLSLDPLVIGQEKTYVGNVVTQILEEGEGVGEQTPPLGSHFITFQNVLDAFAEPGGVGDPALPVVENPAVLGPEFHAEGAPGTRVTNPHAAAAMGIFNDAYGLMTRMLEGFFAEYAYDATTGIRPPRPNAYFQTAFYPFMTMVIRPLGEIVCRLPADAEYVPVPGKLPPRCAGPSFEIAVPQGPGHGPAKRASVAAFGDLAPYEAAFDELIGRIEALAAGLPPEYTPLAGRGFPEALRIVGQNLWRMRRNFARYWRGEMVAPLPSHDFTDFGGTPLN